MSIVGFHCLFFGNQADEKPYSAEIGTIFSSQKIGNMKGIIDKKQRVSGSYPRFPVQSYVTSVILPAYCQVLCPRPQ